MTKYNLLKFLNTSNISLKVILFDFVFSQIHGKDYSKNMNITFINSFMREVLSYRNQSIDLLSKSMDRFLYDRGLRHERVKC